MYNRLPEVPKDLPANHQEFLRGVKKILDRIAPPSTPPGRPTNLTIRPMPGGNDITFTGGDEADGHLLLISPTPNWDPTKMGRVTDLGQSTHFQHIIGQPGATWYYWVVAMRGDAKSDPPTGPIPGTTLGLAVAAAAPKFVPPSPNLVRSQATNKPTILTTKRGGTRNLL